jgi:SAM-dependent methyltransferase
MTEISARPDVDRRPVIYAGRFVDRVVAADLPESCIVLGEQDTPAHVLADALDRANTLVILDLPSFPLDVMTGDHWDVPIVVVLPSGFDTEALSTTVGPRLLERLGFFDRFVVPEPALWKELRRGYCWAESQRVPVVSNDLNEVTAKLRTLLEAGSESPVVPDHDRYRRDNLRYNKALHRVQAAALGPRLAVPPEKRNIEAPLDALEVGVGVGRWASSFDPSETRFVGIDASEDLIKTARTNFPGYRFDLLDPDLYFPYEDESFDLVFGVTIMHHHPVPAKRTLLSEMWRVARPGGQLLLLEDFVLTRRSEKPAIYPMSVREFVDLTLEATAGRVVLEHVESLRYPDEDLRRGGLVSLLRLGVPKT